MENYRITITNHEGETSIYLDIVEIEIINGNVTLTSVSGYKEFFVMPEINEIKIELIF